MYVSEILFSVGIGAMMIILIGVCCVCGKYPTTNCDEMKKVAISKRNNWIRTSVIWISLYYWLVLNSILTTLIVLYISCYEDMGLDSMKMRVFTYSAISLFSSVCPYVMNIQGVAKAYRKAFMGLDYAIMTNSDLAEAIKTGEGIIDDSYK